MKKIIVAGGAGFVGSHLCQSLLEKGNQVFCVDNFYTGREKNVAPLLKKFEKTFQLIKHDTTNPFHLVAEEIYQLASPASPPHYQADPIKTLETNVVGTMNLLHLAEKNKARLLLASTSEIYGDPSQHPQTESYWGNVNPVGIRSCYDEAKRVSDTFVMDSHRSRGVDVRII
ncbi:MAG: GDP-mannose 4,6-dehydratase, partial [Spirochaetia bacterium]|nr:GDP-mannose 4,6-dehydratase [Spirochaetia bacterium]